MASSCIWNPIVLVNPRNQGFIIVKIPQTAEGPHSTVMPPEIQLALEWEINSINCTELHKHGIQYIIGLIKASKEDKRSVKARWDGSGHTRTGEAGEIWKRKIKRNIKDSKTIHGMNAHIWTSQYMKSRNFKRASNRRTIVWIKCVEKQRLFVQENKLSNGFRVSVVHRNANWWHFWNGWHNLSFRYHLLRCCVSLRVQADKTID